MFVLSYCKALLPARHQQPSLAKLAMSLSLRFFKLHGVTNIRLKEFAIVSKPKRFTIVLFLKDFILFMFLKTFHSIHFIYSCSIEF